MTKSTLLEAGQKFNRLTVLKLDHIEKNKKNKNIEFYKCICQCENECIVKKHHLKSGHTQSCGCLKNKKHSLTKTRLFSIFRDMKTRCYNKNNKKYKYYGGKNIIIFKGWLNDFKTFYDWAMANGYKDNLTIDRIDNNGNYEPNNCRWTDMKTQSRNRHNNNTITYNNETYCLIDWAKKLNINRHTLFYRIYILNWSIKKAFTTPVKKITESKNF